MSGHKFLWVLRAPSKHSSSAYFSGQKDDPLEYLPNGFLERTKEKGLVVHHGHHKLRFLVMNPQVDF
jgi:hydroquinone glucosyltransferase